MAAESRSPAHGENSEPLRLARLRPLVTKFVAATTQFPSLCFVAATPHQELPWVPPEERWPNCPAGDGESHFGLQAYQWKELLRWEPLSAMPHEILVWLRFNERLWQGCFYIDSHCDTATYPVLDEALKTFRRLARSAATHFCNRPYADPHVDFPLSGDDADRWLELLLQMPLVEEDGSDFMLMRRLPGNVFDASARAIEYLAGRSETHCSYAVAEVASTAVWPGNTAKLSLLDRFPVSPDGHIAFLEWVRDEVHGAAEAKSNQHAEKYANATIESMIRGIRWEEARTRLVLLHELPAAVIGKLQQILQRELTCGTVVQIDELLLPAVAMLRTAWESFFHGYRRTVPEEAATVLSVSSIPASEILDDRRVVDLLLMLWKTPDREAGIAMFDLPVELQDEALLTVCEGSQLVQFAVRNHSWQGGGAEPKLVLEPGWNVAELAKDGRNQTWQVLREVRNENVPNEIRLRVRLGYRGSVEAAKLALQLSSARYDVQPPMRTVKTKGRNDSDDDAVSRRLLSFYSDGLADERIKQVGDILSSNQLSANEKLTKIDAGMPIPASASAAQLAKLLGVTKPAVLKTEWWIKNRRGQKADEVGRRREIHQQRAKQRDAGENIDSE